MTAHDPERNGPVDHAITAAIGDAETTVPDTATDVLLDRARRTRDRDRARRRRTARILTGAAAAAVLIVAVVAITVTRGSDETRIASSEVVGVGSADSGSSTATVDRVDLLVVPDTGLTDGQEVQLTVSGGHFDPGTPASAMQCAAGSATAPTCDGSTATSLGVMPADGVDLSGPFTVTAGSSATAVYRFDETTGSWDIDPTAGAAPPLSCAAVTSSGQATGSTDRPAPDADEPTVPDHAGDEPAGAVEPGSAGDPGTGTAPAPDGTAVVEPAEPGTPPSDEQDTPMTPAVRGIDEPCVIAVFGTSEGQPRVAATSISFAPTDDDSVGSPVLPADPGDGAPPTTPSVTPSSCPPQPDYEPFTGDPGPDGPLVDFTPDAITVCSYGVDGMIATWDLSGREATELADALNALRPARGDQACTDEMGPRVRFVATAGDRTATVWAEFHGCGYVISGDRFRTGARTLMFPIP